MNFVLLGAEHARPRVIGDNEIDALAGEFFARMMQEVLGLGCEADDESGPPLPARGDVGENIGILDEPELRGAPPFCFLILPPAASTRQSATAAAPMKTSAGKAALTAASISRAVSMRRVSTPAGSGRLTGPVTSVTRAPACAAAAAIAWPCLPEERLAI